MRFKSSRKKNKRPACAGRREPGCIHSKLTMHDGDAGIALIDIFRFEQDKNEELRDFGQPVPDNMIHENDIF